MSGIILRQHAEQQNAEELHELQKQDNNPRPENWQLSPAAVVTYFVGGTLSTAEAISVVNNGMRSPPTSATAFCARTTSSPDSSAPSSKTRCRMPSFGANTWKPPSNRTRAGKTCTAPPVTWAEARGYAAWRVRPRTQCLSRLASPVFTPPGGVLSCPQAASKNQKWHSLSPSSK